MQHDDQRTAAAAAAQELLTLGWPSVLPLPPGRKWPPPDGCTGRAGSWPTDDQHRAWWGGPRLANLALRLPETVIGLDLDTYKPEGLESYRRLVAECGQLPETWVSSSRDDRTGSGIRLYVVPTRVRWAERRAGPGIEVIRWDHRYVVVPPSLHPSGARYRWSAGRSAPAPGDLPALPAAWGRRLSLRPVPPQRSTHQPRACGTTGYAEASLAGACAELAALRPGERRNDTLNRKAYHLAGFVASGQLDQAEVRRELYRVAVANGHVEKHGAAKTMATIDSGLRAGMTRPRAGATA